MKFPRFNEASYAHFVTTKTFEEKPLLNDKECCEIVVNDIEFYREKLGFEVIGYCIMPDHVHVIIWWDVDKYKRLTISKIMQAIKGHSAKVITQFLKTGRRKPSLSPYSAASEGSRLPDDYQWVDWGKIHTPPVQKIWQPSFYDFNIYSEKKLHEKLHYIHYNPVRAGLCKKPGDWFWSSYDDYEHRQPGLMKIKK